MLQRRGGPEAPQGEPQSARGAWSCRQVKRGRRPGRLWRPAEWPWGRDRGSPTRRRGVARARGGGPCPRDGGHGDAVDVVAPRGVRCSGGRAWDASVVLVAVGERTRVGSPAKPQRRAAGCTPSAQPADLPGPWRPGEHEAARRVSSCSAHVIATPHQSVKSFRRFTPAMRVDADRPRRSVGCWTPDRPMA
jgi:hypothetical protein